MSNTVPKQNYVGISKRHGMGKYRLAFSIPYELKDDGEPYSYVKKRIESVQKWLNDWNSQGGTVKIIDNEPVQGFQIVGCVERYRTQNKWFRVEDPRGYELEISCDNLFQLMQDVTIKGRVIQEKCIWHSGDYLVSEDTHNRYLKAEAEKQRKDAEVKEKAKKKSVKNVEPGAEVKMDIEGYDVTATYLGKLYCFYYDSGKNEWRWSSSKKTAYVKGGQITLNSKATVTEVLSPPTEEIDPEKYVMDKIMSKRDSVRDPIVHKNSVGPISLVSASKPAPDAVSMTWRPLRRRDLIDAGKPLTNGYSNTSYPVFVGRIFIGHEMKLTDWIYYIWEVDTQKMTVRREMAFESYGYSRDRIQADFIAKEKARLITPAVANLLVVNYNGEWYPARLSRLY